VPICRPYVNFATRRRRRRHAVHRCLPPPRVTFLSLHSWDQRKPTFRYIIATTTAACLEPRGFLSSWTITCSTGILYLKWTGHTLRCLEIKLRSRHSQEWIDCVDVDLSRTRISRHSIVTGWNRIYDDSWPYLTLTYFICSLVSHVEVSGNTILSFPPIPIRKFPFLFLFHSFRVLFPFPFTSKYVFPSLPVYCCKKDKYNANKTRRFEQWQL